VVGSNGKRAGEKRRGADPTYELVGELTGQFVNYELVGQGNASASSHPYKLMNFSFSAKGAVQ
jgi:hypothetical protein